MIAHRGAGLSGSAGNFIIADFQARARLPNAPVCPLSATAKLLINSIYAFTEKRDKLALCIGALAD